QKVGGRANAAAVEAAEVIARMELQQRLIAPVYQLLDREARLEHEVDDVGAGQIVNILDPSQHQPVLAVRVQPVDAVQGLVFAKAVKGEAEGTGRDALGQP